MALPWRRAVTWTRLSDDFADHPDLLTASRSARLLFVEVLVYCNRHGNNGRFRRGLVARMTDAEDWPDLVDELVKLDLCADVGNGQIEVDWTRWQQEPADAVKERREASAERTRQWRERQRRHQLGDHSMCTKTCPAKSRTPSRDTSRTPSRDAVRDASPSRPDPSRPLGREGEGGTSASGRSARATRPAADPPQNKTTPWDWGVEPTVTVIDAKATAT